MVVGDRFDTSTEKKGGVKPPGKGVTEPQGSYGRVG